MLYSGGTTYLLFFNNLLDKGHRYFGVKNEKAAITLSHCIYKETGIGERMTFRPSPNNQMLLSDNTTVFGWFDDSTMINALPPNAVSLPVSDPLTSAKRTRDTLIANGFEARVFQLPISAKEKLFGVTTNALDNAFIVYRKNIFQMGAPPKATKLTKN